MMERARNKDWARGFGLIEVLIAAGILAIVVGGNAALYVTIRKGQSRSQANVVSSDLLSEGAELVRNLRDTALLDAIPTNSFSSYLDVDRLGSPVVNNQPYRIVRSGSRFALESGTETVTRDGLPFLRSVRFSPILAAGGGFSSSGPHYRYAVISVEEAGRPQSRREVRLILTNWRP